jgi:tetratricopeptide (TPR) repeat protein
VLGLFQFEPELRTAPPYRPDLSTAASRQRVLQDNHLALLRVAWFAAENNWATHAWQLPCAMVPFLSSTNYGAETFELFTGALAAARSIGDQHGEAAALMALAVVSRDRGDNSGSQDLFRQALAVSEAHGNLSWQAQLLTDLGVSQLSDGQLEPAGVSFARAHVLARQIDDERLASLSANNLGVIRRDLGQLDEAVELFERAGHRGGRPTDQSRLLQLINVGLVRHLQGSQEEALAALDEAMAICERTATENRMPAVLVCQAAVHRSLGNLDSALDRGRRALRMARRFTFGEIECMALNTLGETFVSLADLVTAEQVFAEAQAAAERGRHAAQAARAQEGFAHLSLIRGDEAKARTHWEQALRDYPAGLSAANDVRRHLEALGRTSITCLRCSATG